MDIVDFTQFAQKIEPVELVRFLNRIFTACDELCANHGMMKIKTIGDSYMAVAFDGADRAARVASEMLALTIEWPGTRSERVQFRIGIHVGPVVAGVVGSERLQYDVWGDTVNVASRLEGTSLPGRIHVSQEFVTGIRELGTGNVDLAPGTWHLAHRGEIELKGKGTVSTYWLEING
jgi:class 3 adenylate cyclase